MSYWVGVNNVGGDEDVVWCWDDNNLIMIVMIIEGRWVQMINDGWYKYDEYGIEVVLAACVVGR